MRSYFSLAAVASSATAFMIPPNVALQSATQPAIPMLTDPFSIKLVTPCQGCPYGEFKDNELQWREGIDNGLFFEVSVNDKLDTIELNGVQIYPPRNPLDLFLDRNEQIPHVSQVLSTVQLKDIEKTPDQYLSHPLKLTGYGLSSTTVHSSEQTGEEVIKITLSIDSLEGQRINMPPIVITALKNPEVELMVLNVELQRQQELPSCNQLPLLCKFKGLFGGMIESAKHKMHHNCHMNHMGHMDKPHPMSAAEQHKAEDIKVAQNLPHHRPHHHQPHHNGEQLKHHGHHRHGQNQRHRMHSFLHLAARALLTVVIPLLLGILAGILTYTVGMLLGTFIALIWIRWRSSRNAYQPIALGDEEATEDDYEKDSFEQEAPPLYAEVEEK